MRDRSGLFAIAVLAGVVTACASEAEDMDLEDVDSEVTQCRIPKLERKVDVTKRASMLDAIKRVAADQKMPNAALLIAGIGAHETALVQCWKDARQYCQGPWSQACGGPVLAGSGDGACANKQGGLGIFQFDSGTHAATLREYGQGILSEEGNMRAAAQLIVQKIQICNVGPRTTSDEETVAWLDQVRVGTDEYGKYLDAMARCYNGADPRSCRFKQIRAQYDAAIRFLLEDAGQSFWYAAPQASRPEPL